MPSILCPVEYRWGEPDPGYRQDESSFEGWMNVRIENTGDKDLLNVTASISGHPANVTVVQGKVTVGNIKAGDSVWSSDTFRIKADMSKPVDPSEGVLWNIEYDDAQGMHHVIENVPQ